jgi:hypothetical protein
MLIQEVHITSFLILISWQSRNTTMGLIKCRMQMAQVWKSLMLVIHYFLVLVGLCIWIMSANGSGLKISHVGHSLLPDSSRPLHMNHVLYVPSINKNMCSIHKLTSDNNAFMELHPHSFYLKDRISKRVLLQGRSRGGMYPIPIRSWSSSSPVAF